MKLLIFLLIGVISVHSEYVWQYHAKQKDGLRYNYSTNPQLGEGWTLDKLAFNAPEYNSKDTVNVYQYHYDQSSTYGGWRFHFSTNPHMGEGWTLDYYAFSAYGQLGDDRIPVYQFHHPQSDGWRFYFSTDFEVGRGWIYDKIAFYVQSL